MEIQSEDIKDAFISENSKTRKIRAWCLDCYQTFENGPLSKQCIDHFYKKNCNLIPCRKTNTNIKCVRKFTRINSENRHTYCIDSEEVNKWDINIQIQYCIKNDPNQKVILSDERDCKEIINFSEKEKEIKERCFLNEFIHKSKFDFIKNLNNNNTLSNMNNNEKVIIDNDKIIPKNISKDLNTDQYLNFSNTYNDLEFNFINKSENYFNESLSKKNIFNNNKNSFINSSSNLDFSKFNNKDKNSEIHSNSFFNDGKINKNSQPSNNNISTEKFFDIKNIDMEEESLVSQLDKIDFIENSNLKNKIINTNFSNYFLLKNNLNNTSSNIHENKMNFINEYEIKNEEDLDFLFDIIYRNQKKISSEVIKNLRSALGRKGYHTALSLRLKKEKSKSWDFLYEEYKDISPEVEGLALLIEYHLEKKINP